MYVNLILQILDSYRKSMTSESRSYGILSFYKYMSSYTSELDIRYTD